MNCNRFVDLPKNIKDFNSFCNAQNAFMVRSKQALVAMVPKCTTFYNKVLVLLTKDDLYVDMVKTICQSDG